MFLSLAAVKLSENDASAVGALEIGCWVV